MPNLKALGKVVQTDRTLARLAKDKKLDKALTKEEFLGLVNNGIQPMSAQGLFNPTMAKGGWDAGNWRITIHQKDGALTEETAEFTDGRNPQKRNNRRTVNMNVQSRFVSEKDGYRVEPSIETEMFSAEEIAAATSSELQAHNLFKDRKYFELLASYVGSNYKVLPRVAGDLVKTYDPVLDLIAELSGNLADGIDFAGNSYLAEHPTIGDGDIIVLGTHKELKPLSTKYMTDKGAGSNLQFENFKNGKATEFTYGSITFRAIPKANMTETGLLTVGTGSTPVEVRYFIQTTGKFSPVGGKFKSRVFTDGIPQGYGDFAIQSVLYHATTGKDFANDNGEIYKDHVYAIVEADPTRGGSKPTPVEEDKDSQPEA